MNKMVAMKNVIDTWNTIEKYNIKGYKEENEKVMIPEIEYKRLMSIVKNKKYIRNLAA